MRSFVAFVTYVALAAGVSGCTTFQAGPTRPITIEDDVAWVRGLAEPDLAIFYGADPATQAVMRNQIVTARMYIADLEYHNYEARLTKDIQEQGMAATLASLGLTTSSTLIAAAETKTILSGIATAVTGADKAFNEKVLLSNTIQALQTQMRADRKVEAGVIYAKMFKDVGNNVRVITPIAEYTLPMALSDTDAYYQAGTISSALIGLSKTLATAERNADQVKSANGPNPSAVSEAKAAAAPVVPPVINRRPTVIRDVNTQLQRFSPPPPVVGRTRLTSYEERMLPNDFKFVLDALCQPMTDTKDLGPAGSPARTALAKFLKDNGMRSVEIMDRKAFLDVQKLVRAKKRAC